MRNKFRKAMIKVYSGWLLRERDKRGLTQEQMAEDLHLSTYGYIKQEHGRDCCGGLTLALFIIHRCSDPEGFLKELEEALRKVEEDEYAAI